MQKRDLRMSQILRENPFSLQLDRIEPLVSVHGSGASAYVVTVEDRKHKMRVCANDDEADQIERNAELFPHFTPRLLARKGRYILVEFLEGFRELSKKEFLASMYQIGRMTGETHQHEPLEPYNHRKSFFTRLNRLRDLAVISPKVHEKTTAIYEISLEGLEIHVTLDLNDVQAANLMVNDEGRIVYVDEEAIRPGVRGLGLARLLNLIENDLQWEDFVRGYEEFGDSNYLTMTYFRHLQLVQLVRSIDTKVQRNENARALWLLNRLQNLL